jgi:ABC-type transporter Mla subunit MlaD
VTTRSSRPRPRGNHLLVGAIVALALMVIVVLSYYANTGLPFVPTYAVTVALPNAQRLTPGAQVRTGGARVGIVKSVRAQPGTGGGHAYATVALALEPRLNPLPIDSTVQLRPQSVLGGKYLALQVGHSKRHLEPGARLPLSQAVDSVEIEDALRIFDRPTRTALAATIRGYGGGFASRGRSLNETLGSGAHLLGPARSLMARLARPETGLARLVLSARRLSVSLVPSVPDLGPMIDAIGPTLAALRGPDRALARTIAAGPATERSIVRGLRTADPVLADSTVLLRAARAGTRRLPSFLAAVAGALRDGRPALRLTPPFAGGLRQAMLALDRLARDPVTPSALRGLTATVHSLRPTLAYAVPAQTVCNTLGLFLRNVTNAASMGDAAGPWNRVAFLVETPQTLQAGTIDPDLHYNAYPHESGRECEGGNEPYRAGPAIGNPSGRQSTKVDETAAPASATTRARAAGLEPTLPGRGR